MAVPVGSSIDSIIRDIISLNLYKVYTYMVETLFCNT